MSYIDRLIQDCYQAKSTEPEEEFILNDLSDLGGIKKAIYVIEDVGGDISKTYKSLEVYKKSKERCCPKINKKASPIMYVGSSTTNITIRIKQHIGEGYKGTYALHLKHWFTGEYKITIKKYHENISRRVLQIIEDDLSDKLQPAFGKQGGNNK